MARFAEQAEAIARHGPDAVVVHKSTWVNMLYSREFLVDGQHMPKTFAKLVCVGPEQRVVGLHMIGLPRHLRGAGAPLSSGVRLPFPPV